VIALHQAGRDLGWKKGMAEQSLRGLLRFGRVAEPRITG
jgi:hypothetical protein